jgi:hypothetical protein
LYFKPWHSIHDIKYTAIFTIEKYWCRFYPFRLSFPMKTVNKINEREPRKPPNTINIKILQAWFEWACSTSPSTELHNTFTNYKFIFIPSIQFTDQLAFIFGVILKVLKANIIAHILLISGKGLTRRIISTVSTLHSMAIEYMR